MLVSSRDGAGSIVDGSIVDVGRLLPIRFRIIAAAATIGLVSSVPPGVTAQEGTPPTPLLGYCAPPFTPPCVNRLKAHPEQLQDCTQQMDRYIATVFRYRACLTRETERAVRESNEAIVKLRCAQKRGPC